MSGKARRRQLVTVDDARPAKGQHRRPCSDCPWARTALPGWLADMTPEEWIASAHGETRMECHTLLGAECAGAAIYRANVCKRVRDPDALQLPKDTTAVFATHAEFLGHHRRGPDRVIVDTKVTPLEEEFAHLARRWKKETAHLASAVRMAEHPAYREIIAMGDAAVPLLLRELERRPDHWFIALRRITGADPVSQSARGDVRKMADAWIAWGKSRATASDPARAT